MELKLLDKKYRYYFLTAFHGRNQIFKIFPFEGGLTDAITRGRRHCDVMRYRFGTVTPAIVDLEHQEALKESDQSWEESREEPQDTDARRAKLLEKEKVIIGEKKNV